MPHNNMSTSKHKKTGVLSDISELASLFFVTRQIIRSKLPECDHKDPNSWLRLETLRYIKRADEPTMHDVAQYLHVQAPSATSVVSGLEAVGFVVRSVSPEDKRVVRIRLTPTGSRMLASYRRASARMMHSVFSKVSPEEQRTLATILLKVAQAHSANAPRRGSRT